LIFREVRGFGCGLHELLDVFLSYPEAKFFAGERELLFHAVNSFRGKAPHVFQRGSGAHWFLAGGELVVGRSAPGRELVYLGLTGLDVYAGDYLARSGLLSIGLLERYTHSAPHFAQAEVGAADVLAHPG